MESTDERGIMAVRNCFDDVPVINDTLGRAQLPDLGSLEYRQHRTSPFFVGKTMALSKTPAGLAALKDRHGSLTPRQRTAFILFDGKRSTEEVLAATAAMGITQADVQAMLEQGLLARRRAFPKRSRLHRRWFHRARRLRQCRMKQWQRRAARQAAVPTWSAIRRPIRLPSS